MLTTVVEIQSKNAMHLSVQTSVSILVSLRSARSAAKEAHITSQNATQCAIPLPCLAPWPRPASTSSCLRSRSALLPILYMVETTERMKRTPLTFIMELVKDSILTRICEFSFLFLTMEFSNRLSPKSSAPKEQAVWTVCRQTTCCNVAPAWHTILMLLLLYHSPLHQK